ncbi:AraC family transcriptional regulator [Pedobacter sp.]|uniref:AraC family transcriptional regulator n=1 Tax=Pedobacter sp. TaxID=1411316 RepID=UPI003D7FC272
MKPHYKPIPCESTLIKVEFQKTTKDFYYPWHYHSELELAFILSGNGVRYVGNSMENFNDEELVLIGPNLPHTWHNSSNSDVPVTAIVVFIKQEFMQLTSMQSIEFAAIKRLFADMGSGIKVDCETVARLKPKFFALLNTSAFDTLIVLFQILQDIALGQNYRLLCVHDFSGKFNAVDKKRINTVYDYIEKNYQNQISLADIAAKLNMSGTYFSRFFSKALKKPFFEYLNEYKINRACKLLIETDKQVSEICYASGFESLPFFYRQFKKFKNCQPKMYRLNYQNVALKLIEDSSLAS